jgi:TonB family protein
MWNASLALLGHLADASVRVLGLALVAVAVLAIPRMRHAAARHAVWSAVLAGMLALPVLAPLLPPLAVKMFERPASASTLILRNLQASSHSTSRVAPSRRPPTPAIPIWPTVLAGIYLAGVVALLARVLWAWRTCRRLVGHSELVSDPNAQCLLADLAGVQGMEWPLPQLRSSNSVIVPMTAGFSDPVILLPANWQSWDAWKLRAVLAHELAHIRRGDWLVTVAASVNRCLLWFHPLAWWLERHLSALAEQASDDAALGCVSDAPRYASTVLDFAAILQSGRRLTYGVAMARTAKVSRRIDRILALRQPGPAIIGKRTWAAIVLCALPLVYSAAALQVAHAPASADVHPGLAQLLIEGSRLSPAEAQQLEDQVARNPEDLTARGKLIAYYFSTVPQQRQPRLDHVYWLIQHHPESDITRYFSMAFRSLPSDEEYAKSLWSEQVVLHPDDARVLANAAEFLGRGSGFVERDLLERARQADLSNPEWLKRLADLLSRAISHSFLDQTPVVPHVEPSFAEAAKAEMQSSSDAGLVGTVGEFLASGSPGGSAASQDQSDFAKRLLDRAQLLDPNNPEWPAASARLQAAPESASAITPADNSKKVQRIRVGAQVQQGNLIQQVPPVYPPLARQARIQGVVRFNVIIGKDGRVSQIVLISGHPLLVTAAQDAVKQWIYRPTLLNGEPVEVATVVDVQFMLTPEN